jgi:hypothetical protein
MDENGISVPLRRYSEEELLEAIHKEARETGSTPVFHSFVGKRFFKDGTSKPDVGCFIRAFDCFDDALMKAGYKPTSRGDGYSYQSNHDDICPSWFEGIVDDHLQFVPHQHHVFYKDLPGFEQYKGRKDADIVILNHPALEKDYIIEVTAYLTLEQFEGKVKIPPNSRQEKYFKDLHEKMNIVKASAFTSNKKTVKRSKLGGFLAL